MIPILRTFAGAAVALLLATAPCLAQSPSEVLKEVDAIRAPGGSFVFKVSVTVSNAASDGSTARNDFEVSVRDEKKSLVAYRSPPSLKGRVLLMIERNMWIYIPGTKRPIRISPQQQLTGAVSNADVARVIFGADYDPLSMDDADKDGVPVHRLRLKAKEENATYSTIDLWVERGSNHPLQADFFTLSGKPLRSIAYRDYREVLGRQRPTRLDITSTLNTAQVTSLVYSDMELKDTPEAHFQPAFLDKID
jgi:hypothetical protein